MSKEREDRRNRREQLKNEEEEAEKSSIGTGNEGYDKDCKREFEAYEEFCLNCGYSLKEGFYRYFELRSDRDRGEEEGDVYIEFLRGTWDWSTTRRAVTQVRKGLLYKAVKIPESVIRKTYNMIKKRKKKKKKKSAPDSYVFTYDDDEKILGLPDSPFWNEKLMFVKGTSAGFRKMPNYAVKDDYTCHFDDHPTIPKMIEGQYMPNKTGDWKSTKEYLHASTVKNHSKKKSFFIHRNDDNTSICPVRFFLRYRRRLGDDIELENERTEKKKEIENDDSYEDGEEYAFPLQREYRYLDDDPKEGENHGSFGSRSYGEKNYAAEGIRKAYGEVLKLPQRIVKTMNGKSFRCTWNTRSQETDMTGQQQSSHNDHSSEYAKKEYQKRSRVFRMKMSQKMVNASKENKNRFKLVSAEELEKGGIEFDEVGKDEVEEEEEEEKKTENEGDYPIFLLGNQGEDHDDVGGFVVTKEMRSDGQLSGDGGFVVSKELRDQVDQQLEDPFDSTEYLIPKDEIDLPDFIDPLGIQRPPSNERITPQSVLPGLPYQIPQEFSHLVNVVDLTGVGVSEYEDVLPVGNKRRRKEQGGKYIPIHDPNVPNTSFLETKKMRFLPPHNASRSMSQNNPPFPRPKYETRQNTSYLRENPSYPQTPKNTSYRRENPYYPQTPKNTSYPRQNTFFPQAPKNTSYPHQNTSYRRENPYYPQTPKNTSYQRQNTSFPQEPKNTPFPRQNMRRNSPREYTPKTSIFVGVKVVRWELSDGTIWWIPEKEESVRIPEFELLGHGVDSRLESWYKYEKELLVYTFFSDHYENGIEDPSPVYVPKSIEKHVKKNMVTFKALWQRKKKEILRRKGLF